MKSKNLANNLRFARKSPVNANNNAEVMVAAYDVSSSTSDQEPIDGCCDDWRVFATVVVEPIVASIVFANADSQMRLSAAESRLRVEWWGARRASGL